MSMDGPYRASRLSPGTLTVLIAYYKEPRHHPLITLMPPIASLHNGGKKQIKIYSKPQITLITLKPSIKFVFSKTQTFFAQC
jgi:hypothetical protein